MSSNRGSEWVLYGATGYTGRLIVEAALALGLRPVLAGRDEAAVRQLAERHGLGYARAAVDNERELDHLLAGRTLVLNAAGPFSATATPIMSACLRAATHYLDIGGDLSVLEAQFPRAEEFRAAGLMALLAVGFDVVPSDFAARCAADRVAADEIHLGISCPLSMSKGSSKASVEELHRGQLILSKSRLRKVNAATRYATFDFGAGPRQCIAVTWGDLISVPVSTGVDSVRVYFEATADIRRMAVLTRFVGPLARFALFRKLLAALIDMQGEAGPSAVTRAHQSATIVAHALRQGRVVGRYTVRTPDPYDFTAQAAAAAARSVLAGSVRPGCWPPSAVLPRTFLSSLQGVQVIPDPGRTPA
jgi:short subunit dehydrogenase-like uncharacterized protein